MFPDPISQLPLCPKKATDLSLNDIQQEIWAATTAQHLSNLDGVVELLQLVKNGLRRAPCLTTVTHTTQCSEEFHRQLRNRL